jgi:LCP family protein required for cell wall assembly
VFAIPAVAVALILLYQARQGLVVLVARFIDPGYALGLFLVVVALGAWRVASVTQAFMSGAQDRLAHRNERRVLGALLAVILVTHGVGAIYAWSAYEMDSQIFGGGNIGDTTTPDPNATPNGSFYIPGSFDPGITPVPSSSRVTILIAGLDRFAGRSERLYDTLMVVSLDTATNKVAMISVPRDSAGFPLYWGGWATSTIRINSLVTYVNSGKIKSPDAPLMTLVKEVSFLVGIPIDYYAVLDLSGFVKMIDMVGGIDVDNPTAINDPEYDWLDGQPLGFYLSAGKHHLNGKRALAYVRSRKGTLGTGEPNTDWSRASRQQEVLVALEHKMADPSLVLRLPEMMQTVGGMLRTNYPASKVADMVAIGQNIPKENITQVVLGPPYSVADSAPSSGMWVSCLRLDKVAELSIVLFGKESRYYAHTQRNTCGP